MTERKRTRRQERSYVELLADLYELEVWARNDRLKRSHIPPEWHSIDREVAVRARKTRITLACDADVARWYRSMGHGYQARMNKVLRTYMLGVISKEIEVEGDRSWKGDPI
ncbi:BrnA antitoxin family protein [Amaricoccus macauensis]|uniref:BrnA antitoxin family protein n=1 Tax=Amaricoccus macauensis TaxID=57001 RepID=UPI003C7EB323